ncbi:MAG: cyclic dehypoxanthinyl futalosine synthase [bacterium]
MQNYQKIKTKILEKKRLSLEEYTDLFNWNLLLLGILADQCRENIFKNNEVGFIIDRNITFSDICVVQCDFCAFYKKEKKSVISLSLEKILEKIDKLQQIGGTQVMLQSGLNPNYGLSFYKMLVSTIKKNYPKIYIHSFSPAEIYYLAKKENLSYKKVLISLKESGLDSLPGAAEILSDRVRKIISPQKLMSEDWLKIMETAHLIGMETTSTMTFGIIETKQERIEHLLKIRNLQDKTNGFRAFIPWTFSPQNTKLSHIVQTSGEDYLKTVAISRIVLDNIKHIHSGWVTEGWKLGQIALLMGANDLGGILMDEVVVKSTGLINTASKEHIIKTIKQIGKIPVERNSRYEVLKKY